MSKGGDILKICKLLPRRLLKDGILTEKAYLKTMEDLNAVESKLLQFTAEQQELVDKKESSESEIVSIEVVLDRLSSSMGEPLNRPGLPMVVYFISLIYREQLENTIKKLDEDVSSLAKRFDKGELAVEDVRSKMEMAVKTKNHLEAMLTTLDNKNPDYLKEYNNYEIIKEQITDLVSEPMLDQVTKNAKLSQLKDEMKTCLLSSQKFLMKTISLMDYIDNFFPELKNDLNLTSDLVSNVRNSIDSVENKLNERFIIPIKVNLDGDLMILVNILPAFSNVISNFDLKYESELVFPDTYISSKREKIDEKLQTRTIIPITNEPVTEVEKGATIEVTNDNIVAEALSITEETELSLEMENVEETISAEASISAQPSPWTFLGYLVADQSGKIIGSCSFPYYFETEPVISYYKEKPLPDTFLEALSKEIFSPDEKPDSPDKLKESIINHISRALDIIPTENLLPSVVLEYCGLANIDLEDNTPLEPLMGDLDYAYLFDIEIGDNKILKKIGEDLSEEESSSLVFFPPPETRIGGNILDFVVALYDKTSSGIVKQVVSNNIGHLLVIERDVPPVEFVRKMLKISHQAARSDPYFRLQSVVARKIDTFEGESLLYWNLWKYCWLEKIPVMPWELFQEFVAFVPAIAVNSVDFNTKNIRLKRGTLLNDMKTIFPDLSNYSTKTQNEEEGNVLGISITENGKLEVLWCAIDADEIIKRMRKTSSSKARLVKRIASALKIKEEKALLPTFLLKYFLYYATFQEFTTIFEAMSWLCEKFDLRNTPFIDIRRVDFKRKILYI